MTLVWPRRRANETDVNACSAADARASFGPRFVNYLARFLLAYDVGSRRLWRARSDEYPRPYHRNHLQDPAAVDIGTDRRAKD